MNEAKLTKVLENMKQAGFDALLVSSPMDIYYLTGIKLAPGERLAALLIDESGSVKLVANKLFALKQAQGIELVEYSDTDDCVEALSSCIRRGRLGIDKEFRSRFLLPLIEKRTDIKMALGSRPVELARMVKTKDELVLMREASHLNDLAIAEAIKALKDGVSESDIADAYRKSACELGEGESFESLICFGANAAEPHHDTDRTLLKRGDAVIIDVGLKFCGYCSDMTRTVFFGETSREQKAVYELVRRANEAGRNAVRPGVRLSDVDAAARRVISEAGYGEYFIHRTGHSIGLEVHEFPDVSSVSDVACEPGMVFSVEPGIYLPGRFGVRVEDLVEVTEDGARTLNEFPRELTVI